MLQTIIPDENILLNFNEPDWAYAGPIGTGEWSPDNIETPEYHANEGWRYATTAEWTLRPDWSDFIIGNASVNSDSGFSDHSLYRFASEYWSNFNHIDLNDAAQERIANGFDIGSLEDAYETWYEHTAISSNVPEPSPVLLLSLGLFGLAIARTQKKQTTHTEQRLTRLVSHPTTNRGRMPLLAGLNGECSQEQAKSSATGADLDSTPVTKPEVHVVMTANHVNPKLYLNSRKRRFLRFSSLIAANGL